MTAIRVIESCVAANAPALVWGPPGVGKTASIVAAGKRAAATVEVLIGSQLDPVDVGGILVPDVRRGRAQVLPPAWALRLREAIDDGRPAWLVLDELTCAPRSVQAALLRVVQERQVAGVDLREVRMLAAANPADLAADGVDLSAATANRWIHVQWEIDVAAWAAGMRDGWGDEQSPATASARVLVARYILATRGAPTRPGDVPPLLVLPRDAAGQGGAWPSPRSWDAAARLLAAVGGDPRSDLAQAAIGGAVGQAAATALLVWLAEQAIPDAEALLADPARHPLPDRLDRVSAAVEAASAAAVAEHAQRAARVDAAWTLLGRVPRDVAIPGAGILCRARQKQADLRARRAPDLMVALSDVLDAAGA